MSPYINFIFTFKGIFYLLVVPGALIMFMNMIIAAFLKKRIPGGFVGRWLNIMWVFMFFSFGGNRRVFLYFIP